MIDISKINEVTRANICGDGWDADARAERIEKAVRAELLNEIINHESVYTVYDDEHEEYREVIDIAVIERMKEQNERTNDD